MVGGFSSSALFLAFAFTQGFQLLLYLVVLVVGTLVGLEIPLLMRLDQGPLPAFSDAVSHVLTFDYSARSFASVLFPLVLVPQLGLIRSALFFGLVNAVVALWSTRLFAEQIVRPRRLQVACVAGDRGAVRRRSPAAADQRVRRGQHLRRRDHPLPRHAAISTSC